MYIAIEMVQKRRWFSLLSRLIATVYSKQGNVYVSVLVL